MFLIFHRFLASNQSPWSCCLILYHLAFPWLSAPGASDPTAHRRLLSSDSSDSDNAVAMDIAADLGRLRERYSRLAAGQPVRPRDVPGLVSRPDDPPLAVSALSWHGGDLRPSCMLLALLPVLFPSLPVHARHALSAAARRLSAREAALDGEVAEYQSTYAMKLACEKTKDRIAKTAAEEMCKMARRGGRRREVLVLAKAKEFLKAVEDVSGKVARHGARWHARAGTLTVPVEAFERVRTNARAAADDAW